MSSIRGRLRLSARGVPRGLVGFIAFAGGISACLFAGCSDDPKSTASSDAASDAPAEASVAPPTHDAATKTCREDCEDSHAAGLTKDQAIDSCWQTNCAAACIEMTPFDGGADGGTADAGTCSNPVVTVSEDCDTCTRAHCCTEWDGCFSDGECAALNACYQTCVE